MNDQERRRFVRIEGKLKLWYEPISEQNPAPAKPTERDLQVAEFANLDNQLKSALMGLIQHSPKTTKALDLLNKKLNALYTISALTHPEQGWQQADVNLSACGISFLVHSAINVGKMLQFKLQLNVFGQVISTLAKVVACEPNEGDQYTLRLDFIDLTEQQEDTIIQYIFQEESAQLRQAKANKD